MVSALLAVRPALSVTVIEKEDVPASAGVPVIFPAVDIVSPGARLPVARDHENGPLPPLADNEAEYEMPTVPSGSVEVLTASCFLIEIVRLFVVDVAPLTTVTVNETFWAAVGMPLMTPAVDSVSPVGRLPAAIDHV